MLQIILRWNNLAHCVEINQKYYFSTSINFNFCGVLVADYFALDYPHRCYTVPDRPPLFADMKFATVEKNYFGYTRLKFNRQPIRNRHSRLRSVSFYVLSNIILCANAPRGNVRREVVCYPFCLVRRLFTTAGIQNGQAIKR